MAKCTALKIHRHKTKITNIKNKSTKNMCTELKSRKCITSSILSVTSEPIVTLTQRFKTELVLHHRHSTDCRASGNHQSWKQWRNLRSISPTSIQIFSMPQKLEEPVRCLRASSKVLRDIIYIKSSESTENNVINEEVSKRSVINNMEEDVKQEMLTMQGHVLWINKIRHLHIALRWAPPGQKKWGRLMGPWRRSVKKN